MRKSLIISVILITILPLQSCSVSSWKSNFLDIDIEQEQIQNIQDQDIVQKETPSIIYQKEIFQKYGNDLDKIDDDTVITNLIKTNLDLTKTETIYRVKHEKKYIPVETFLMNNIILVKRNLVDNDAVLIDSNGIEKNTINISELKDFSNSLLSDSGKYLAYTEKDTTQNTTNLLITNFLNDSTSEIRLAPIIDIKGDLYPLCFSSDEKNIYMKFISNEETLSPVIYVADLETEEAMPLKFTSEIANIQSIFAFDDLLFIVNKETDIEETKITIEKIDLINQTIKTVISNNENASIENIKYSNKKLYYNLGSDIYLYEKTSKLLLENAKLIDIDNNNDFFIYEKSANFDTTTSMFLFNISTKTSKEIFKNDDSKYGSKDYIKNIYIGIEE